MSWTDGLTRDVQGGRRQRIDRLITKALKFLDQRTGFIGLAGEQIGLGKWIEKAPVVWREHKARSEDGDDALPAAPGGVGLVVGLLDAAGKERRLSELPKGPAVLAF